MDAEIRVITESWPWRRKFSCHSCRDLNLWPFNLESGTLSLTTELSPLPCSLWVPRPLALPQWQWREGADYWVSLTLIKVEPNQRQAGLKMQKLQNNYVHQHASFDCSVHIFSKRSTFCYCCCLEFVEPNQRRIGLRTWKLCKICLSARFIILVCPYCFQKEVLFCVVLLFCVVA